MSEENESSLQKRLNLIEQVKEHERFWLQGIAGLTDLAVRAKQGTWKMTEQEKRIWLTELKTVLPNQFREDVHSGAFQILVKVLEADTLEDDLPEVVIGRIVAKLGVCASAAADWDGKQGSLEES
jgi:hypothetical protein